MPIQLKTNEPQIPSSEDQAEERYRISPVLIIFALIPLLGIAIAVGMLASEGLTQNTPQSASVVQAVPSIINALADDFEVSTLSGETVRLADYRGRVVFLNFWATWCPPCIRELPALQQFATEQSENGAVVLAINSVESVEQISTYLTENNIDLSSVPVLLDSDARIYQRFGIYQMPTTYVIDSEGVIRTVKYGEVDVELLYAYIDQLSKDQNATNGSS